MRCISLLLILSCFSDLAAQEKRDILRQRPSSSATEENRDEFNLNYSHFGRLISSDLREATKYLEVCERKATELGDSLFISMVLHGKGYVMLERGKPKVAIDYLNLALGVAKRNLFEERIIFILNSLAIAYSANMEYDKALLTHLESLRRRESNIKFERDISLTLANIGSVYAELGDYMKASDYYQQSYNSKLKKGMYHDLPYLIANIAAANINLHQYAESLSYIKAARAICDSIGCDQRILGELGLLEGTCKIAVGEIQNGLAVLEDVMPILRRLNSYGSLAECYFRIAVGMSAKGRFDLALKYCDSSSVADINSTNKKLLIKRLILKGKCMAATGHYDSAFVFVLNGYSLDSTLAQSSLVSRISAIEASMLERENVLKIKAQEEVLRYQRDEIVDNELLMSAFLLIVVLVGSLLVASVRISRQRRKINSLLSDRIVESTYELSNAHDSLVHSNENLKLLIAKMESVLSAEFATLKGLKMLSRIEATEQENEYMMKAEGICLRLIRMLREFKEVYLRN